MQRLISDGIQIFLIGIDRQDPFRVSGFVKPRARALLFSQLIRRFQQVILNRFEGFMRQVVGAAVGVAFTVLRQVVSEVDHTNTQRTTTHRSTFGGRDRVILIVQQRVECAYRQNRQLFQFIQAINCAQVESRQRTQRYFTVLVVDIIQRFGRQGDFQAQVRLAHWRDGRIKRAMGIAVVNVLNIDTTGRRTFLHHQREQLNGFHTLLADAVVFLIFGVQAFKLFLIGEERVVQPRYVGRAEQGDIFTFQQTGIHQFVDLYPVVHMTHAVAFHPTVVFQHQQAFNFQMPHRVEQRSRTATHTALRAGFHRCLEMLIERNTTGMERFATANRATQRTNTPGIDADPGTLGNVFNNRAGGGVNGIQAVTALDQYAGAELTSRGTHAGHDWRRQRNFKCGNRVVKTLHVLQARFTRVVREQARGNQNIKELGAFVDFAGHTVLHQIFAFQLLNRSIRKGHITVVIDKRVHLLELFFRVVFQQMIIVFAHLDHFHHVVVQRRRLKLAVGFFTQVEDRQARGEILIIRRITGDQVCGSLDNGFVDVRGLDTVIKLNVGAQFDLGNRNVMQSFCRPIQNAMDFVEIDALCATVALCHQQILIHVCRTCFWNSFRNSFMQTTCSEGSCLEHYI